MGTDAAVPQPESASDVLYDCSDFRPGAGVAFAAVEWGQLAEDGNPHPLDARWKEAREVVR